MFPAFVHLKQCKIEQNLYRIQPIELSTTELTAWQYLWLMFDIVVQKKWLIFSTDI